MKVNIKKILLCIIMVVLFLPLLQEFFTLSKVRNLSGDYVPANDVPFTRKTWFNKTFQEQKEKFLNDHFGYHNTYVRLHNQIAYYLFKKAKANGVIIGKNNYLYEERYIDAYYGTDFIGQDSIRKRMLMLSFLEDTLRKQGKTFLLVFAPGKGAYFPEYIPEHKKSPRGITNIEVYRKFAREMNIPHIDFHSWFIENKTKSPYPLIPKYGIHWSQYGSTLAFDSILRTVERKRNVDMPNFRWLNIIQEKAKYPDTDIEDGMNLLFRFDHEMMAYPEVKFDDTVNVHRPSVLVVADSYYWQIYAAGVSALFTQSDFWYYFKEAHNPKKKTRSIDQVNIPNEIKDHDVIILMSTDVHLPNLGWGFIETLFGFYKGTISREKLEPEYYEKIKSMRAYIRTVPEWMAEIEKKAKINKISVDSMLYLDAKWSVDHDEDKQ